MLQIVLLNARNNASVAGFETYKSSLTKFMSRQRLSPIVRGAISLMTTSSIGTLKLLRDAQSIKTATPNIKVIKEGAFKPLKSLAS